MWKQLGDTAKQARRDGAYVASGPAEGCRSVTLPGRDGRPRRTDAYLQPKLGIVGIFAREDMRTPEGIALGRVYIPGTALQRSAATNSLSHVSTRS